MQDIFDSYVNAGQTVISNVMLQNYHKLGMTDEEFIIYIFLNNKIQQGILFPDINDIAQGLGKKVEDVSLAVHNLMEKKLLKINVVTGANNLREDRYDFSLLHEKLKELLRQEINKNDLFAVDRQLTQLYKDFEDEMNGPLTPMQIQTIHDWITEDKYDYEIVRAALREAVLSQVTNLNYIGRILVSWEKEGIKDIRSVKEKKKKQFTKNKAKSGFSDRIKENTTKPKIPLTKWSNK